MKIGSKIIHLESVDSTNNYAANLVHQANCINGTVILADDQYLGKGQRGSEWLTSKGDNLTSSIIIYPDKLAVDDQFYLTCMAALSVVDTLKGYGIQANIKWPNDIYVNQEKIGGILIENVIQGNLIKTAIIGIGLNVNSFPKAFNAICMQELISKPLKPFDVLMRLINCLNVWGAELNFGNLNVLLSAYNELILMKNQIVAFEDEKGFFNAKVLGVSINGFLELALENEMRSYGIKQVTWRLESNF